MVNPKDWVVCCDCRENVKSVEHQIWHKSVMLAKVLEAMSVSHGYCPQCYSDAKVTIDDYFDQIAEEGVHRGPVRKTGRWVDGEFWPFEG